MDIPVVEMILDESQFGNGIDALSLVRRPATKATWITLSENSDEPEPIKIQFAVDKEKRIIIGPALIPNQLTMRDQKLRGKKQKFYVFFSPETVERSSQLYLMNGNQNKATLEHQVSIQGVSMVESWIKVDMTSDKSNAYPHLKDYPVGTWFVALKIVDEKIWTDYIKSGKVQGISIEGYFADRLVEMSQDDEKVLTADQKVAKIKELLTEYEASK